MRIKINGRDIDPGDRVTIETSPFSDSAGWLVAALGLLILGWIASGGLLL